MAFQFNHLRIWLNLIWLFTFSAIGSPANSVWFTRIWQTDDGLINNNILAAVQGLDGYLWVVPSTGLMRFDGVRFTRFPLENFTGPTGNHGYTALCGRSGVLWLALNNGTIIGVNPDFSITKVPKSGMPPGAPFTMAEDVDGTLWMGYRDAIFRLKGKQIIQYGIKQGMPFGSLHSMIGDGQGKIWLAKGDELCFFHGNKFHAIVKKSGVRSMAATKTNGVWFISDTHLYTCDTNGEMQDHGSFHALAQAAPSALLEDNGSVWIGTEGSGLIHFDQSGFKKVDTSYSSILSLAKDHEGNLWVGTDGGGLERVSSSGLSLEVVQQKPPLSQIKCICQDTNGTLWGSTQNGTLVSRVNDVWIPVFTNASFNGTVACVAADNEGAVWVGTQNGQLFRLINSQYTWWGQAEVHGIICSLLPTSSGDLWIMGRNMLQRLHKGKLMDVKLPVRTGRLFAAAEDAAGNIWFGASSTVLRFNGKKFFDESHRLPIANRNVCCLYGTPDGSMWISCGGLGLLRFKNGQVGQVGVEQGLFNDYISQIVADHEGYLWFASDHGIFKIKQRELGKAMKNRNIRLRSIVYGSNEGLSGLEALFSSSSLIIPYAIHSQDGRVWLLTHTGVVVADPKLLPKNQAPNVLLTQMNMDGKTIASYSSITATQTVANLKTLDIPLRLPPSHRHLEFRYTAFHFSAPENIHFRYRLMGFDESWIDAGSERHADYSRLTTGKYQFCVTACIGDGPWSKSPATLSFVVTPFFWQTWWFRLSLLLLFTTAIIAIVRYISFRRMRQKLLAAEQRAVVERERGRIARDIHDDLGERLTEIQLLTGLAQQEHVMPKKIISHVQQIWSTARQATDALDEIVWAVNPRNDTLPHLINYIGQFTVDFLRTAEISCRTDLPEQPPDKLVSAEVRHNLFLVTKESLNNIVRHANASEVSLLIFTTDESIQIVLEDNGCGFNGKVGGNGADGLENMRLRIIEIGGQLQIKSTLGVGTSVSFGGPWLIQK